MASARIPDELFDTVAHHLPWSSPMGPKGRWLQIGHRVVIGAIWNLLTTDARWQSVLPELACSDLPAPASLGRGRHQVSPAQREDQLA